MAAVKKNLEKPTKKEKDAILSKQPVVKTKEAVTKKEASVKKEAGEKRTPNPAFMKALTPSAALAAVVGANPLPRTEVVSKLWAYIKKNDLQDKSNRRNINADAKLKLVFGKEQVTMFEMAGLIGKHLK